MFDWKQHPGLSKGEGFVCDADVGQFVMVLDSRMWRLFLGGQEINVYPDMDKAAAAAASERTRILTERETTAQRYASQEGYGTW